MVEPAGLDSPHPADSRLTLRDGLSLAAINLLWAGSAVSIKLAIANPGDDPAGKIGPLTCAFLRFALAVPLLYLLARSRGHRFKIRREDRRWFLLIGTLGVAVTYAIFYGGIRWTTASESTVLVATEPILIAVMAWIMLAERLTGIQSLGMVAGLGGVYLIVYQGLIPRASASAFGNAAIALALAFEAFGSVMGKRLSRGYPGLVILTVSFAIGSLALLPLAAWESATHWNGLPGGSELGALAYMALVCTFFCYAVWFQLLPRIPVSAMGVFLFIQPVMGPVYGYLFRGERIHAWTVIGAGLVLLGVYLVARQRQTMDDGRWTIVRTETTPVNERAQRNKPHEWR